MSGILSWVADQALAGNLLGSARCKIVGSGWWLNPALCYAFQVRSEWRGWKVEIKHRAKIVRPGHGPTEQLPLSAWRYRAPKSAISSLERGMVFVSKHENALLFIHEGGDCCASITK